MRQRLLTRGGHIAVVAPSGIIDPAALVKGVRSLSEAGFDVSLMPHARGSAIGVFAASDSCRASDLTEALTQQNVDAVWCTRGGYGCSRTIQNMSREILEQNDKVVVGFSDITALHSVRVNAGGVGLLGPMLKHIAIHGMESADVVNTLALLSGERVEIACEPKQGSRSGTTEAKIVGGNLAVMLSLRGTPAEVKSDGCILFLEDVGEYRYHIDGIMQNLRYGGVLEKLKGIVVGQMTNLRDGATPFGCDAYKIVADAVADYGYPVLLGYPSGHDPEVNQPILLGSTARLTVADGFGSLVMQR